MWPGFGLVVTWFRGWLAGAVAGELLVLDCMDVTQLSDADLLNRTEKLVEKERENLTVILRHLREIERRKLYSKLKCASLFDYAMKVLKYSEDQAYTRIAAMRLLKETPELEKDIQTGALSLSNCSKLSTHFRKHWQNGHRLTGEQRRSIANDVCNKSAREADRILASHFPEQRPSDKFRSISEEEIEFRFVGKRQTLPKVDRLRGMIAHSHPHIPMGELLDKLCDVGLSTWTKSSPGTSRVRARQAAESKEESKNGVPAPTSQAALKRQIHARDQVCTNCGSTYALEIDHKQPKALGGKDTPENLRLLCRNCNQRAAIETFGVSHMEKFRD